MKKAMIFATVLAMAACSKKGGGAGGGDVDVSKTNAAIPASWKGKIEFEAQKLAEGSKFGEPVMVAAPKGWKKGFMDGELDPPDGSNFGFGTSFKAMASCHGDCKSKTEAEWAKDIDENLFSHRAKTAEVKKDEKAAGKRTVIVHDTKSGGMDLVTILVGTWSDGAERAPYCEVQLAKESQDLAPAFEQACLTILAAK